MASTDINRTKVGRINNPDDFDPINPEISITGIGVMDRNSLRQEIFTRLKKATKTARDAAVGDKGSMINLNH